MTSWRVISITQRDYYLRRCWYVVHRETRYTFREDPFLRASSFYLSLLPLATNNAAWHLSSKSRFCFCNIAQTISWCVRHVCFIWEARRSIVSIDLKNIEIRKTFIKVLKGISKELDCLCVSLYLKIQKCLVFWCSVQEVFVLKIQRFVCWKGATKNNVHQTSQ